MTDVNPALDTLTNVLLFLYIGALVWLYVRPEEDDEEQ